MKHTLKYLTNGLVVFVLLFLAGCDSGNNEEEPQDLIGSFNVTISGAVNETLEGNGAAFGAATDPQTGLTGFGLTIGATTSATTATSLSFVRRADRPGEGSYTLINYTTGLDLDDVESDIFIGTLSLGAAGAYFSQGGTLTITESTNSRLEGSFDFTAVSALPGSTDEVTIQGTFNAIGADFTGVTQ